MFESYTAYKTWVKFGEVVIDLNEVVWASQETDEIVTVGFKNKDTVDLRGFTIEEFWKLVGSK